MNPTYPCLGVPADGFCPQTPTYPARECTSGCSWWGSQYQGTPWPTGWGNAANWPAHARTAGFTLSAMPPVNSIMCIPPNHNGAGPNGHVAFVTGPVVNGKVPVIEMNFLVDHGYSYRNAPIGGCEFIHLVAKPVPPAPSPPVSGDPMNLLYQGTNGTIYAVFGNTLVPLSSTQDVDVFTGAGWKLVQQSSFTVATQTEIGKLPKIS